MEATRHRRPPRLDGRGKRILLWTIGMFWAGQFGVGLALDYGWPEIRFPFLFMQVDRAVASRSAPMVVCLGSSRFGTNLDEAELTRALCGACGDPEARAFNAAVPGGDYLVDDKMLHELLQRGVRPRFALVEICPEVVNHRNEWLNLHVKNLLTWEDLPAYFVELMATGHAKRYLKVRALPIVTYRSDLQKALETAVENGLGVAAPTVTSPHGAMPGEELVGPGAGDRQFWDTMMGDHLQKIGSDSSARTQAGLYTTRRCLRNFRPGGNSGKALERVLSACRQYGIQPILIAPPLCTDHLALYTPDIEGPFLAYVRDVCRRHDCSFVDCRRDLTDDMFLDNHHVGAAGQILFSRKLSREVLIPAWQAWRDPGDRRHALSQ